MNLRRSLTSKRSPIYLSVAASLLACSGATSSPEGAALGGATANSGGAAASTGGKSPASTLGTGGVVTAGGAAQGGQPAQGGLASGGAAIALGGAVAETGGRAGAVASGGTTSTGGTTAAAGSTTTRGGATASGGTTSTGGTSAKGGTTTTGGASSVTGGTSSRGGATGTGGTSSTGGAAAGGVTNGGTTSSTGGAGGGVVTNSCGTSMRMMGNPFNCKFAWGANNPNPVPANLNFITTWVGTETDNYPTSVGFGAGSWVRNFVTNPTLQNVVPFYIAYFIAFKARQATPSLNDCNVAPPPNLCSDGALWIRNNRDYILWVYQKYAEETVKIFGTTRPFIWLIDPDFYQYTYSDQKQKLSFAEVGALAKDVICRIKGAMPNAVIAMNHSTWMYNVATYWSNFDMSLVDLMHTTGIPSSIYFNTGDANNRAEATWKFLYQTTGHRIIADTSFGVSAQGDTWSTASVANLNARIADGLAGVFVGNASSSDMPNYNTRIGNLSPQLSPTCP